MEMFRFGNSEYLWGLLIIPLLHFFYWSRIARKKALKRFGKKEISETIDAFFIERQTGF